MLHHNLLLANGDNPEDEEEKEQDRLAKQFAKRARMNRILEAYEGDTEFSRSRLIDEDASMQVELKTMKVSVLSTIRKPPFEATWIPYY